MAASQARLAQLHSKYLGSGAAQITVAGLHRYGQPVAADAAHSCQATPGPQVPFTICTSLGTVLRATSIWHVLAWGVSR